MINALTISVNRISDKVDYLTNFIVDEFNKVNVRLDVIEHCTTIKKELKLLSK